MKRLLLPLAILFLEAAGASPYEGPSPLKALAVSAEVSFDTDSHLFDFKYKVTNPKLNDGEIADFKINISHDPGQDAPLSATHLGHCLHHSEGIVSKRLVVPVGSQAPKGWSCDFMPSKDFAFSAIDDPYVIKPGSSLSGLTLISYGLPGIRSASAMPDIDMDRLSEDWEEDVAKISALRLRVIWKGITIGPKAPPLRFTSISFIDYISLLNEQAAVQNWVKSKAFEESFELQISGVKKRLIAKDNKTARALLKAFLESLKAQKGKGLTSEGYALLYFNAQYLIERL